MVPAEPGPTHAPIITASDQTAQVNSLFTYLVPATDPDGGTLRYMLGTDSPLNATINSSTGLIQWTPATAGDYTFTVLVSDRSGDTATASFTVRVEPVPPNRAPIITASDQATQANFLFTYLLPVTDPDDDALFYLLTAGPAGATMDANTGLILWTPATAGSYIFTVTVYDGTGHSDTASFTVTVGIGHDQNGNQTEASTWVISADTMDIGGES